MPQLTLLIFCSSELGSEYLSCCLSSIREWNAESINDIQVMVVIQNGDPKESWNICEGQPFPVDMTIALQPHASNGYPIWDICEQIRQVQSRIKGQYLCVMHSEFVWCYNRIQKTIDWLKEYRPYLAIGNLRRVGNYDEDIDKCYPQKSMDLSNVMLRNMITNDNWSDMAWQLELIPSTCWSFWKPQSKIGRSSWEEDIFFVNMEWFNVWKAVNHGGRLPFQDVFDLMGIAVKEMIKYNVPVSVYKMPLEVNKVVHLEHNKTWNSFTPVVRDYFLSNAKDWVGTTFIDVKHWDQLIKCYNGKHQYTAGPIIDFRNHPGGTAIRYAVALSNFISSGGNKKLEEFYAINGRDRQNK